MTATAPALRRRRRLALSLRGLMLLILALAVPLAWKINHARTQKKAVEAIQRAGGTVSFDFQFLDGKRNPNWHPPRPAWLWRRLGSEYFGEVVDVSLYDKGTLTDDLVARLASLPALNTLQIGGCKFSVTQLGRIASSKSLRTLDLSFTGVTDEGIARVSAMSGLQRLELPYTKITDAGLRELLPLVHLRDLNLQGTSVTAAGLAQLAELPELRLLSVIDVTDPRAREGVKKLKQLHSLAISHGMNPESFEERLERLRNRQDSSELEALKDIPHLKDLKIDGMFEPQDFRIIASFSELERLDLSVSIVSDHDVLPLRNLRRLKELDLEYTNVTAAGVSALQKANPSLKILSGTGTPRSWWHDR